MTTVRFPRRIVNVAQLPVNQITPINQITLTLTYATAPNNPAPVTPAPMKYDKWACLQYDQDDGGMEFYRQVFPYFNGGLAADGVTYPGLGYTDGAGGSVKYRANGALFGINTFNNTEIAGGTDSSKFTYAHMAEMIQAGWDMSNHSLYHTDGPDYAGQVTQLTALITTRLAALGLAYDLRTAVVPTNYAGFVEAFFDHGMIGVSSQGTSGPYPMFGQYTAAPVLLADLPATGRYVLRRGFLGDPLTAATVATNQGYLDTLLASTATTRKFMRLFSHFGTPNNLFQQLFDYAHSHANDRLWVPSFREWAEYYEVKKMATITQSWTGNVLTVVVDQAAVPTTCRWKDMSLLVPPGATASVSGADRHTHNATTGLLNLYKQKLT